jgi:ABC-2 type transport system ATP-binding protein
MTAALEGTVPALHAEALTKAFNGPPILDAITLSVRAGERLALVGPNGAGKTTLIRCLLGQYHCQGEVSVFGRSPRAERTEVLARIGFVPQLPPPLRMPVGQLIRFAAKLCGAETSAIEADSARLGLDVAPIRRQAFVKLSGGQKQKLLIAIALRPGTGVLVMDEPAANLDPAARRTLFQLLAERSRDTAMVIASHRLDEVAGLVERVVELDRGRILLDDRITGPGALDETLACRLELARPDESAARSLDSWGFRAINGDCRFEGSVAAPDRLRFFGMLARYSGLIVDLSIVANREGSA